MSLTRTVTSAAALAALALVCGPVAQSSGEGPAAAAAVTVLPDVVLDPGTGEAPAPGTANWTAPLPIRPSTIAKVAPGSVTDAPVIQAAAVGPPGTVGALGIPLMVLRAYRQAATRLATEQPSCKLPWWLLAGIGHTESGHAQSGRLAADGTTRGRILGPRLNGGIPGDAIITDTDKGSYDGDKVYDRAVGPMQFIPSTWVSWGADGNADGKVDPSNIFDATLSAGRYLCAHDRNLATPAGLRAAILSYNYSAPYLATVLAWGRAYRDGASAVPNSPLPVVSDVTKVRPPRSSRPPKPTVNPSKLPSAAATPAPSSAAPAKSGSASASPSRPPATSTSASPSASETTSCASASPSPTQTTSGTKTTLTGTATARSATGKPAGTGSATAGGTNSTASGTAATATGTASTASRLQSTAAESLSSASSSATASPTLSSCAP